MNNAINLDFVNLRDCSLEANKAGLNKNLGNISLQNEKVYFYIGILTNRIHKLMELKRSIDEKKDVDIAIDNIRPRIFWKDKPIIKKQLRLWNIKKLEQAMKIVLETEVVIKTKFNSLSNILIKKLLIELCNLAETNA
jgi:DNA polymerase-3 subunit delta